MSLPCNVVRKCVGCSGVHMRPDADPCGRALWRFLWSSGRGVAMSGPRSTVGSDHGSAFGRRGMAGAQPARRAGPGGARRRGSRPVGYRGYGPWTVSCSLIRYTHKNRLRERTYPFSYPLHGLIRYTAVSCPFTDLASRSPIHRIYFNTSLTKYARTVLHAPLAIGHL